MSEILLMYFFCLAYVIHNHGAFFLRYFLSIGAYLISIWLAYIGSIYRFLGYWNFALAAMIWDEPLTIILLVPDFVYNVYRIYVMHDNG